MVACNDRTDAHILVIIIPNYLSTKKAPFSVKVKGIPQTLKQFDAFDALVKKEIDDLISEIADDYYDEIYDTAPVDTTRYRSNWYKTKVRSGHYKLYNSYMNVIDPRGAHYGDYLVYGISRFKGIASKAKYRYGNPMTGALHDISLLNFEMTKRVVIPKTKAFTIDRIKKKTGFK